MSYSCVRPVSHISHWNRRFKPYCETIHGSLPAGWHQCKGRWEAQRPQGDILAVPRIPRPCVGTHGAVSDTQDVLKAELLFHNKPSTSVFLNADCVWIWHKACSKNVDRSLGSHFDTQRCEMWAACLKSWRFLEVERYKDPLQRV